MRLNSIPKNQTGSILILVAVFFTIMAALVGIFQIGNLTSTRTTRQMNVVAQADNAARGGITDATAWFRRQSKQPVGYPPTSPIPSDEAFYPRNASCDTMDESVGLVKEYPLGNGNLWAHYELVRSTNSRGQTNDVIRDVSWEVNPNISLSTGYGRVWSLISTGYVFQRMDQQRDPLDNSGQKFIIPFNQPPNKVLAKSRIQTNLYRVYLNISGETALHIDNLSALTMTNNSQIQSSSQLAILHRLPGPPNVSVNSRILGSINRRSSVPSTWISAATVFGSSPAQLKQMSDVIINNGVFSTTALPALAMIYCDGDVTFDSAHPLKSSGFLIVNGNLTVSAGTAAQFSGVVHVTGTSTIADAHFTGGYISNGPMSLNNSQIRFDMALIPSMRNQLLQYRPLRSSAVSDTNEKALLGL